MSQDVLFCGLWDEGPGYPRTTSLRRAVVAAGGAVRDCRVAGVGRDKQRLVQQPWRWPAAWWQGRRDQRTLQQRLRAELAIARPDCIVVPYPGHRVVADVRRSTDVPIVLDLFLSAYDTVVEDRRLVAPGSLLAQWCERLDRRACSAADLVLLDTPENAAYVAELTGLPAERFAWLPVHDPDAPTTPFPWQTPRDGQLELLFFGTGVPLHGLDTLLAAVASVPRVRLVLVGGTGPDRNRAQQLLGDRLVLEPEFVDRQRLAELLARCHLVAGIFGASGKAQRVVPFKVVHALAAGRPVLTAATPAVCRWLDGSDAVFFAPAAEVGPLAAVLRDLARSPARLQHAAAAARPAYERRFGDAAAAGHWQQAMERLAANQAVGGR
jgi:glycosyltransferase involved in cell wall biosynthesis